MRRQHVAEPLPNAEVGRVSQESVPVEQEQPLRAIEQDEKEGESDWETDSGKACTLLPSVLGVQHACLENPLMILIDDGKTQEILGWTLLRLITVTFTQRSVCSTRS